MFSARRAGILGVVFPCVAIAQIAYLQIKITDGESAVHAPGVRVPRPLSVLIMDEGGRPVAGATVSFQVQEDGPGGRFANGLQTDVAVTDANGIAVCGTLVANRVGGPFQIRITAVKENIRAGVLSKQYNAEAGGAAQAGGTAQKRPLPHAKKSHTKAIVVVLAIAGAAAGGFAVSRTGSAPTPASVVPAAPALAVSTPTISVGKP